jgi:hypothetical protein
MRSGCMLWLLLTAFSAGGGVTYYGPGDFKKYPDFGCLICLPDKNTWEWGDPSLVEKALALGKSKDGMMMVLFAEKHGEPIELDEAFIADYEQTAAQEPNVRRVSGKKITFAGVPAYELTLVDSETNLFCFNRVFIKNQTEYMISMFVPNTRRMNRARLDTLFEVFDWMETEEQRNQQQQAEKTALESSFVYKDDVTGDDVKYAVSDARGYECRVDDLVVRVSVSGHKLVSAHSGSRYNMFNVCADDKAMAYAGTGFASNIMGALEIQVQKQEIDAVVKSCKDKYKDDPDTLLVKEIVHDGGDSGARRVTLLFVTNFIEGKPCVYRGFHYVQAGKQTVAVHGECAQGMAMSKEYTESLNNILQSALATVRINDQALDLSALARHVRKR